MKDTARYDYVIVGAGSAGCVLANRLSADPDIRVLLLEAGGRDASLLIRMPSAMIYPMNSPKYSWQYYTEPQARLNGRRIYWPRGRVLGGSSSINSMEYVRGHAYDYDRWAKDGLDHWSYAHCLPYFKRLETRAKGPDDYRGGAGPIQVSTALDPNPLGDAFIEAGQQAGYPFTEDMNGYQQEGFGRIDMNIHRGRRCSTADAYLRPALKRPNLAVEVKALTTRVLFEGTRAVGVEYVQRGRTKRVRAEREVVLSGGAINSPQLLVLSGVGNPDELKGLGVPVVADLPGVGQNLQDHLEILIQHACTQPVSLYRALKPFGKLKIGLDWIFFKKGLGATNHFEAGGFIRTRDDVPHPDLQYHFMAMAISYDGSSAIDGDSFQVHADTCRPTSVGYLKITSADPTAPPIIEPHYLETEEDRRDFRAALRLTREIVAQEAFDPYRGPEITPGKDVQADADIDRFVAGHAGTAYHPCGTVKMGTDEMAVVDGETKVRGLEGLRVVDSSIIPSIVSGNLNAPTIMIAEKAADMILGKPALKPEDVPVYDPAKQASDSGGKKPAARPSGPS